MMKRLLLAALLLFSTPAFAQQSYQHAFGSATTATIAMVPAVAGQRVYVFALIVSVASPTVAVTLRDTTPAAMSQAFQIPANANINIGDPGGRSAIWQSAPGLGVQLFQSGTTAVGFDIWYVQAP